MTGEEVKALAQARVKNTQNTGYDWDFFFGSIIDEIFTYKGGMWKFNRQQLNYIHTQFTFEKTMSGTPTELALNKIVSLRFTTSYSIVMGVPVPASNSSLELDFKPLQAFMYMYPDQIVDGVPECYTILHENDGLSGMQIGLYPRPFQDASVWIDGIFIPAIILDTNEIPILPVQFHRMLVFGMASMAASQAGQDALFKRERAFFDRYLADLVAWDAKNAKHIMTKQSIDYPSRDRKGPFFPGDFPRGYSR